MLRPTIFYAHLLLLLAALLNGCGSMGTTSNSNNGNGGGGNGGMTAPVAPVGLTAIGGDAQVSLSWSAVNGATSYNVKRSTTSGGPYAQLSAPTGTSYVDS